MHRNNDFSGGPEHGNGDQSGFAGSTSSSNNRGIEDLVDEVADYVSMVKDSNIEMEKQNKTMIAILKKMAGATEGHDKPMREEEQVLLKSIDTGFLEIEERLTIIDNNMDSDKDKILNLIFEEIRDSKLHMNDVANKIKNDSDEKETNTESGIDHKLDNLVNTIGNIFNDLKNENSKLTYKVDDLTNQVALVQNQIMDMMEE